VLSHEMAHVLAKHASIREDQARQAAIVTRVVTDMSNDPDLTRAGAGENQADDGEPFPAPRSSRPMASVSAFRLGPISIPTARRVSWRRWSATPR
jgi:Putative Zn-dependent protease